jgi:N-acetylmuramoyl-L-alanine amidase
MVNSHTRNIRWIVVHCTATPQSAKVSSIQNYWKNSLKWKSPGYHKIIEPDGNIVQLASDNEVCNGVAGYNSESLHVSYIGGVDTKGKGLDNRTPAQQQALWMVVKEWKNKYPGAVVQGHRDFKGVSKECPSFDARAWWETVNC